MIGGTVAVAKNVISGNAIDGIRIESNATGNTVIGNRIGTNPAGMAGVYNRNAGVALLGPPPRTRAGYR